MKRAAYFFLLIFLLSCGASYDSRKYSRVAIKLRDSPVQEFLLLSVRQDTLIISPYHTEGSIQYGSLIGSADAIPFTRIEKIYRPHEFNDQPIFWGGLAGCFCGGCIGSAVWINANEGGGNKYPAAPYIGIAIGFPAGIFIGYLLQSGDTYYSLNSQLDVAGLRQHAFFQTEPPELQKIK